MFEKFTEVKPIESKEIIVKRLAREMLERFRARFKGGEKNEHIKESVSLPESISTKEIKVVAEEEKQKIAPEPKQPEEFETTGLSEQRTTEEAKPAEKEQEKKINKGAFESTVTNSYFEGWDESIELEGNPEIKEQIKQNIVQAEKTNEQTYVNDAYDLGISVEEFKSRLQAKIENMIERASFFSATQPFVLEKIMNVENRWKSQFETNASKTPLCQEARAISEMKMFGFNKTSNSSMSIMSTPTGRYSDIEIPKEVLENNKEKRPIYGYFSDEKHGAINGDGKIPPPTSVSGFGAVNVKIKKERALKKTTITFHDSLGQENNWPPTPAAKPHFTSFPLSYSASFSGGKIINELESTSRMNWGAKYTEVQYHNNLTVDDIESIHISANNGLSAEEIEEVRRTFKMYKEQHPESTIQLVEF